MAWEISNPFGRNFFLPISAICENVWADSAFLLQFANERYKSKMKGKKIKKEYVIYRQNLKIIFFLAFFITLLFCYVSSVPQIELPTFSLSSIQVVKFPVSDNLSIYLAHVIEQPNFRIPNSESPMSTTKFCLSYFLLDQK